MVAGERKNPRPMFTFYQSLKSSKKWHKSYKRKGKLWAFIDAVKYVQVVSNDLRRGIILGDRLLSL